MCTKTSKGIPFNALQCVLICTMHSAQVLPPTHSTELLNCTGTQSIYNWCGTLHTVQNQDCRQYSLLVEKCTTYVYAGADTGFSEGGGVTARGDR